MRRHRRIRREQLDFLLLETFGWRYLPDAVAVRIALRRELADGLADALNRRPDLGREPDPGLAEIPSDSLEAVVA